MYAIRSYYGGEVSIAADLVLGISLEFTGHHVILGKHDRDTALQRLGQQGIA